MTNSVLAAAVIGEATDLESTTFGTQPAGEPIHWDHYRSSAVFAAGGIDIAHGVSGFSSLAAWGAFKGRLMAPDSGGGSGGGTLPTGAGRAPRAYDIVPYGRRFPPRSGLEKHHGIMNAWAEANVPGYKTGSAPTIALTTPDHNLTRALYPKLVSTLPKTSTGAVNWKAVSARQAMQLSEELFDAARVPRSVRDDYYRAFNQYQYGGQPLWTWP